MGLGPFDTFSFPNVYTQTLNEPPRATAAGNLRFAAFVGVASEIKAINNFEMIRGSSALADNKITRENVSSQLNGTNRNFTVTYFPIVSGNGTGTTTTDPASVVVTVNGAPVPVSSVNGATGEIFLVNIPATGDEVLATYYFKETDEHHVDEDLSDQVDGVTTIFRTHYYPVVIGNNGGITTTDPTLIEVRQGTSIVLHNNAIVPAIALDGNTGLLTLATAPAVGQHLSVSYYSNEEANTSDILPSPFVADVRRVGYAPGTSPDFYEGIDFVVDTTGAFTTLNWGHSVKTASGAHTIATNYWPSTTNPITTTLYDNHVFRRLASGTADGTNKTFVLEATPTNGSGRGISTENPDLLQAWYGLNPTDATAIDIDQIVASTNSIVLDSSNFGDTSGQNIYVTQYTNNLPSDRWTLTDVTSGATGVGAYTISGVSSGVAMNALWSPVDTTVADTDFVTQYTTGAISNDVQVIPGYAVAENVTLTFVDSTTNASKYIVTSNNANGTGSAGDNTGYVNQTYIDNRTGFRLTIHSVSNVQYIAGDFIGYAVSPTIVTAAAPTLAIPGLQTGITTTTGIGVGDTALINTYNLNSANEPAVGDFYYVSFDEQKQFTSTGIAPAVFYTQEKDVFTDTGTLTINNKVGLAAHLCFLNGAAALAILQIQKTEGGDDAPDSRYIAGIDYFNEPMVGGVRPALMQPVTTSAAVINYLRNSNVIQSGIRYANERMSYFGFPIGTTPTTAQTIARAMNCERMIGLYPDGAITVITDQNGNDVEYLVDGAYMAAAVAGRDTSPAFDVAEPLTRKPIVGFNRLYRRMDSVTAAQTANAGLTLFQEQAAGMIIQFGLTTDLSSVLTRTPSVIRIKDFVQRGSRTILQQYIGQKFLTQKTNEIQTTLGSYMNSLKQASIIKGYTGIKATVDPNDPTIVNVEAFYSPVLPLLWIVITFNLRSSI